MIDVINTVMNKQVNVILLTLAVGFVLTVQTAFATNESSYQYGYKQGKYGWADCTDFDADCSTGLDHCNSAVQPVGSMLTPQSQKVHNSNENVMTNKTACVHGYINGWNDVCNQTQARSWPNNEVTCPTTWKIETLTTVTGHDYARNSTTGQPIIDLTLQNTVDKRALIYYIGHHQKAGPGFFVGPDGTTTVRSLIGAGVSNSNETNTNPTGNQSQTNATTTGNARALTDKGVSLGNLGNHAGAIEYYEKALAINPKYVRALYNKGYDLAASGNHTGAIEYYDKALAIDPQYVDALNNKGVAFGRLGNYTGAIEYFGKALAIRPHDVGALTGKGVSLNGLRNYNGAIEYFDKALAIRPHDVGALEDKGISLYWLGNYTGAIEYLDKALAIDPKNTFALTNKAAILDRLGNHTTTENLSTSQPRLGQNETTSGNKTTTTIVPNGTITRTLPNGATPYDSGYSHGCSDAKISNLSERYINQQGKGTNSHTFSFMHGYYNGYSACSTSGPPAQKPSPTVQQQPTTNESWRYNAGLLQGVSGVGLKTNHTQEFMSGYAKGIKLYWYSRGYVEGNNKLPMSSTNVNYTRGYKDATFELQDWEKNIGKLPAYTSDNYRDFYLGVYQGGRMGDWQFEAPGPENPCVETSKDCSLCPPGHSAEYCAGYHFGYEWTGDEIAH